MLSECRAGIQLHKIRPFYSKENPFVKVEVVRTFGAQQTYMNRLYLHSDLAEDMRRDLGCHKAYDRHREATKHEKKSAANGNGGGKQHGHHSSLSEEGVRMSLVEGDRIGDDAARTFGTKTLPRSTSSSTSGLGLNSVGYRIARDLELGSESRPRVLLRSRRQTENKKQELQTDEGRASGVLLGTCWKEGRRMGQQHAHQQQGCTVSELQALKPVVDSSMVSVQRSKNASVSQSPGVSPVSDLNDASSTFAASLPDMAVSMDAPFWNFCGETAKIDYRDATITSTPVSKASHNAPGGAAGNTLARMDVRPMNKSLGDCAEWLHDQSNMLPNLFNEDSKEPRAMQSLPNDKDVGAVPVGIAKVTGVFDSHSRRNAEMETSREPSINLKQAIALLHQKVRARHVLAAKLELQQARRRLTGTAVLEGSDN